MYKVENNVTKDLEHIILNCSKCDICNYEINVKYGKMLPHGNMGKVMIVGQNPSYYRQASGTLVGYALGPSTKQYSPDWFLWKVIEESNMPQNKLYFTNVLKCSTPENREPTKDEIDNCLNTFLLQELAIIKPYIIIALGVNAFNYLSNSKEKFPRINIVQVFHHSYISRKHDKYDEWLLQWKNIKSEFGI